MPKQKRFRIAGHPHLVYQRGHNGTPVVRDDTDCQAFLSTMHDASIETSTQLHAFSLSSNFPRKL